MNRNFRHLDDRFRRAFGVAARIARDAERAMVDADDGRELAARIARRAARLARRARASAWALC